MSANNAAGADGSLHAKTSGLGRREAFLAGPDGSWINGQVLRANGGMV